MHFVLKMLLQCYIIHLSNRKSLVCGRFGMLHLIKKQSSPSYDVLSFNYKLDLFKIRPQWLLLNTVRFEPLILYGSHFLV